MERFIIDGNGQRIIRVKDDKPANVDLTEAYVQYAIPFSDVDALVAALKSNGNIKVEVIEKEVPVQVAAAATITNIYDKPEQIINTQANIIDKQLNIIQSLLIK